jgi:hypothetical protein
MMAYYEKVLGETKEEAETKAREEIARMDYMRSPTLESVQPAIGGGWVATIKYYGLD